jgi:hypothetical protein
VGLRGGGIGEYCGQSIDGYGDTLYLCSSTVAPPSVVQICPYECTHGGQGVTCE